MEINIRNNKGRRDGRGIIREIKRGGVTAIATIKLITSTTFLIPSLNLIFEIYLKSILYPI